MKCSFNTSKLMTGAQGCAYLFENRPYDGSSYNSYKCTIKSVEQRAGFDFFQDGPFRLSLEGYVPDDWRFRLKAQYRLTPDLYLFSQFTRPMSRSDGGNYYGISYAF
jgi:hypothetical protein